MALSVRRAAPQDIPALDELTWASSAYQGGYRRMTRALKLTEAQLERDECFVAVEGEEVLGYYILVTDPPDLDLMFVADPAQGQGVGRLLFDHMRARARALGIDSVRIVAHPPALSFYERMGAVRTGTKPPGGRATWERPVLRVDTR